MSHSKRMTWFLSFLLALGVVAGMSLLASPAAFSQVSLSTGGVSGTVTDPQGAAVPGARVIVSNKEAGFSKEVQANSTGYYSLGALSPGVYTLRVEASGFKAVQTTSVVQVGEITTSNIRLDIGSSTTVVEVSGATVSINTEQATVGGVLTANQMDTLPVNGRNFLDFAQLEPGVQIQEGSTFDPTKNGFSSISFDGRFGRTARIEVDGVDISDETVGTTTQNIPASAIEEFQLSQSSLDLSTELTSSGAVNVTTRSGTNTVHGQLYGLIRDDTFAAALPGGSTTCTGTPPVCTIIPSPTFQRQQFGGRVGGPIIKDKLFWFIDGERSKQDLGAAEPFSPPFDTLPTALQEPFRETQLDGRVDWNIKGSARMFYRFNFDQNSQIRPYGSSSSLQGFLNQDHTPSHTIGVDFNTGSFTHSIRFEYLKFRNAIADGTSSIAAGVDNPVPGLGIGIGAPVLGNCVLSGGGSYCGGPNLLAPQQTFQSNKQIKYDGSKSIGKHTVRYGVAFNHIQGGGLAAFFTFPQVGTTGICLAPTKLNKCPTSPDPTVYNIDYAFLGNGVGFSTPEKAFGLPAGGLGPDNRFEWYVGDSWKIKPRITLTAGLHYVMDTGRVDSNLGPQPVLNDWGPGLGNQVRTPKNNFSPTLGLAWDVKGDAKTVIRAGGGLYYENSIWNNVLFDSPARIPMGIFAYTPLVCFADSPLPITWPTTPSGTITGGTINANGTVSPTFCGSTIASAGSQVIGLSNAFKAAAASVHTLGPNPNFIGTTLNAANANGFDVFNPNYRTPRSWQMNVGVQRQILPGMIVSADFIRNVGEHYLLAIDQNHSGAARSFNMVNAIAARDSAQVANGCSAGSGQASCMITALGQAGAQAAYSAAGLDSNLAVTSGGPCSFCAFPGINPVSGNSGAVGTLDMLSPVGRSVYNGLQFRLTQNVRNLVRGVKNTNFIFSYSLSKFVSQVQDQDFINLALNNDNPLQFTGPNGLDRKNQFSFGGTFELPLYTRLGFIGHFYSPLPQNILMPSVTSGGEIFATDWLGSGRGSGTPGEPVPGTQVGQFMRSTNAGNLQNVINTYNTTYAGTLTPAGAQLVNNNVMTSADMTAMGWVMPVLPNVAPGAVNFPWLKSFDLEMAWPIPLLKEKRFKITPSVSIFNLFNFRNSFLPGNLPSPNLTPGGPNGTIAPGFIGGTTAAGVTPYLASFQSGTYALGAPRQFEFGLKIDW